MDADDEIRSLLGAYAIDAVDDIERVRVDRYLTDHPDARAEVDRMTMAFEDTIEAQSTSHDLPADLWSRITDQLADKAGHGDQVVVDDDLPVASMSAAGGRGPRRRVGMAAAAAIALLASIGGLAVVRHVVGASKPIAEAAEEASRQPAARQANLRTADGSAGMRVVVDPDGDAYLLPAGLPVLSPDQTYQLWSVDNGQPESLGLIGTGAQPTRLHVGQAPTRVAVSAEPSAGSARPTTTPIVAGELG